MSNRMTKQHQKNIIDSFFKLLTEKSFEDIFVIDIANNAHLSRRTFYRIFQNKDDIIDTYVQSLLKEYTDWILKISPQTYDEVIEDFFSYWPTHSQNLQILVKAGLGYKILDNANSIFPKVFTRFHKINDHVAWHLDVSNQTHVEYLSRISVGIFWNTFCYWLEKPDSIALNDLANLVKQDLKQLSNY